MRTLRVLLTVAAVVLIVPTVRAQRSAAAAAPDALLDKMTGHWVMTGTIGKQSTTHDVDVDWILKREYLRIHEVSREKDAAGAPQYEAWIHIAWDAKKNEYAVLWLDNTATFTFTADGIGHGKRDGDRISMVFKDPDGTGVHTTFSYDRAKDAWAWTIDNVDKAGTPSSFAKLTMTRKN
ncbi:MAG TPA: hypothetical protein VJN96_23125 [Vicinamibacterales bacterium]|nr:hypothetical protein [Vicinamibacterales bacterium]